jgi:hypothetical protein
VQFSYARILLWVDWWIGLSQGDAKSAAKARFLAKF